MVLHMRQPYLSRFHYIYNHKIYYTMRKFFLLLFLLPLLAIAQKKQITLEDIYKKGTFRGESVRADFGQTSKSRN